MRLKTFFSCAGLFIFCLGMLFAVSPNQEEDASISSDELHKVVDTLFSKLKEGSTKTAYDTLFSKEFKLVTSEKEFENFTNAYPILSQFSSYHLPKFEIQTHVVFLKGDIVSEEGTTWNLELQFVKEEGSWKILHMEVSAILTPKKDNTQRLPPKEEESPKEKISKIVMGLQVDNNGKVTEPIDEISSESKDIYVNVFYKNGRKGTLMTVLFQHDDVEPEITPVSAIYESSGDAYLTFIFSPPIKGWSKGDYEVVARSATGVHNEFSFKIN